MTITKKLRRGGFCTDIHFGKKANSMQHNEDCINYIKWFCEQVKENKCDYVGFLGDWNENRSALNIHTLNHSYQGARMINDLGIPVYFVVGNHDLYYRHSREIHSVVTHNEFENFVVIDKPTVVEEIEGTAMFAPYLFHDEYPSLIQYLKVPFWAGHFEFKGFIVTGYNITMPTGPASEDFKGPKYIVSGHFHKRQTQPDSNVIYIGNTFPMDFGDAGDTDRGMMIYDHIDDEMWFENWEELPRYIKTTLTDILDTEKRKNILFKDARINCLVDVPITFEESNYLKQKFIDEYGLREFILEESPDIKHVMTETEADIDWENVELQGIDDLVLLMLDGIDSDHFDKNILKEQYKQIKVFHD